MDSLASVVALLLKLEDWVAVIKRFVVIATVFEDLLLVDDALHFLHFHIPHIRQV
jgi:hypothetical protein